MATKTQLKPGTAVKKWDEELAKYAAKKAEEESSVALGKFISLKSGVMSYNGNNIPGNKISVVVIDSVLENHYYEDAFDPDNVSSPVCFAFGRDADEMVPHEKSPKLQAPKCAGCIRNEWGSAERGRGKACKNVRRLALVTEDVAENATTMDEADIAFLKLSVTNVKGYAAYVQQLATTMKRPPFAVVTEISVQPDPKSQFKVSFKYVESINDSALLDSILKKVKATEESIMFPYAVTERENVPPRPNKFTKPVVRR